jgi:erythrin-vacuolar iron transport family protein
MPVALDFSKLTLMDALDLAILIEIEALERYRLFAGQLGHSHAGDPASVFRMMVTSETKHADELAERRKLLFGDAPRRVDMTALYDVEAPDVAAIRWDMSTLHAYKIALNSERKAHDFYDQALPHVEDGQVRALFTDLRDEEVEHIELVQKAIAALPPSAAWELSDLDD